MTPTFNPSLPNGLPLYLSRVGKAPQRLSRVLMTDDDRGKTGQEHTKYTATAWPSARFQRNKSCISFTGRKLVQ